MSTSQLLLVSGILLTLHSAYSCLHYRELLRDLEEASGDISDYPLPPLDVWIEVFLGAIIILISELVRSGSTLQPVATKGGFTKRPMMAPAYRSREFDIYTSRARACY
mmetsp:Transcript_1702/g.2433  ORF Transcript_1702/g.2433 Transcript_1702/m.2433 type:complete len:108 (+) Transcript_1702:258-581(+)